nr:hypothetical protein GCM10010200_111140 [Actinomadura rugatobispora]
MTGDGPETAGGAGRRRAELVADIAAIAIPHSGPLRDRSEFRESAALNRPSILRRVAADLAPRVPREAERLVAAGWGAAVLATALSLHTGLPLSVAADPEPGAAPPVLADGDLDAGRPVALVVASTTGDAEVAARVARLEEQRAHVVAVLSLLAPERPGASGGANVPAPAPRAALLTEEELAVSTAGGRA